MLDSPTLCLSLGWKEWRLAHEGAPTLLARRASKVAMSCTADLRRHAAATQEEPMSLSSVAPLELARVETTGRS